MGAKERRLREKQLRKDHILDTARSLLFKKGINATTMNQIARNAELSVGTLYLYFKNKEDLLLSIPAKHFLRHSSLISNAFKIKEPKTKLTRLIREIF